MAPSTREDTTATLETAEPDMATTVLDSTDGHARPAPWHERPVVLITAAIVGVIGLIALAASVVAMSDESAHPGHGSTTATAISQAIAPAPEAPPTTSIAVASPAEPPIEPPTPSTVTGTPHFAAGPTVEMMVAPSDAPSAPPPFRLPRWLLRMFHPRGAPDGSN